MSADNYLLISQKAKKKYLILNKDMNGGGFIVGETDTFKEARKFAKEYMQNNIVEYGLEVSDKILSRIKD